MNKFRWLVVAFVLELLLLFWFRNETGYILSPLLMTASGLFLAVYPYFLLRNKPSFGVQHRLLQTTVAPRTVWSIVIGVALVFLAWAAVLFHQHPVRIEESDIIPFIRDIMVKRFVNGEQVYAKVEHFNQYPKAFTPNYLPFQWMPFAIPYVLNIDLRWVSVGTFVLFFGWYAAVRKRPGNIAPAELMLRMLPALVVLSIFVKQGLDIARNIELLIMSYYLFLSSSLFANSNLQRGTGIALPILSRYAFVFWLPNYALALFRKHSKSFWITALVTTSIVLGIFVVPFVMSNPEILHQSDAIYLDGAMGEWRGQSWQQPGDKPFQLFQGMGFASWFYMASGDDLLSGIITLKRVMLAASVLATVIALLAFRKFSKVLGEDLFALCALKFCLTFFYAFILVPYLYLFWVPEMVSSVILLQCYLKAKEA